jgi:hypothetical protein
LSPVIVLPIYRPHLTPDECLALDHLEAALGAHEIVVVAPRSLDAPIDGFECVRFDDAYFESRTAYSRLLLSAEFYRAFVHFDCMLVYQLDCLVFSDELAAWCERGYDYIGAPLFRDPGHADAGFSRTGNGGFSLRRIRAFLDVLEGNSGTVPPSYVRLFHLRIPDLVHNPRGLRTAVKRLRIVRDLRRGVPWYTANYSLNEDLFWSDRAPLLRRTFSIAPVEEALRFAFERHPRYCYERNGRHLPFGTHAWAAMDREFWTPFLRPGRHTAAAATGKRPVSL